MNVERCVDVDVWVCVGRVKISVGEKVWVTERLYRQCVCVCGQVNVGTGKRDRCRVRGA